LPQNNATQGVFSLYSATEIDLILLGLRHLVGIFQHLIEISFCDCKRFARRLPGNGIAATR
jgi:hypothetical protein